ncbi:MAG: hypothetical protein V4591_03230 [Bdellovibrionota bacterium]
MNVGQKLHTPPTLGLNVHLSSENATNKRIVRLFHPFKPQNQSAIPSAPKNQPQANTRDLVIEEASESSTSNVDEDIHFLIKSYVKYIEDLTTKKTDLSSKNEFYEHLQNKDLCLKFLSTIERHSVSVQELVKVTKTSEQSIQVLYAYLTYQNMFLTTRQETSNSPQQPDTPPPPRKNYTQRFNAWRHRKEEQAKIRKENLKQELITLSKQFAQSDGTFSPEGLEGMKQAFALFFDQNLHTAEEMRNFLHNILGGKDFRPLLHQILMDAFRVRLTSTDDQEQKNADQLVQTIYLLTEVIHTKLQGLSGGGYEGTEIEASLKNIREVLIPRFYTIENSVCTAIQQSKYLEVFETCLTHHNTLCKFKEGLIALNNDNFCGTLAGLTAIAAYNGFTDLGPLISCVGDVNTEAFLATGAMVGATGFFAILRSLLGRVLSAQMQAHEQQERELLELVIEGMSSDLQTKLFSTTATESAFRKKMNHFVEKRLGYKGHRKSTDNAVRERTIYFLQDTGGMSDKVATILNSHEVKKAELSSKKTFVSFVDIQHELEQFIRETPNPLAMENDVTVLEKKLEELKQKFLSIDKDNKDLGIEKFRQAVHFATLEVDGKRGTLYNLLCLKVTTKEGFVTSLKRRCSLSTQKNLTLKSDQNRYERVPTEPNEIHKKQEHPTEKLNKLNSIFTNENIVGLPKKEEAKKLSKKDKSFVDEKILDLLHSLHNAKTAQEVEIIYNNIKQSFYTKDREVVTKLRHVVIMGVMSNKSAQITNADKAYLFKRLHHDVKMAYSLVQVAEKTLIRRNKGSFALSAQARQPFPIEIVAASGYQGFAIAKNINAIEHAAGSGLHPISDITGSLSFESLGSALGCWALFIAMISPVLKYRNVQKTTEIASLEATFYMLHKEYEARAKQDSQNIQKFSFAEIETLAKMVANAKKGSLSLMSVVAPDLTIQDVLNKVKEGAHGEEALRATLEDYHCQSEALIIALMKKLAAPDAEELAKSYYCAADTEKTVQDYYQARYGKDESVENFPHSDRMRKYLELEWAKKAPSQEQAQFLILKARMCLKNWQETKNLSEEEVKACQTEVGKFARSDKMKVLRQESKIRVFLKESAARISLYGQWGVIKTLLPALLHTLIPIIKTIFVTVLIPVIKVVLGAAVASAIAGFIATPVGATVITACIIVSLLCVYGGIRIGGNHYFTDYFDTSTSTKANKFAERQIELMAENKSDVVKWIKKSKSPESLESTPLLSNMNREDGFEASTTLSQPQVALEERAYIKLLNKKCLSGGIKAELDSFLLNLFNDILQFRNETLSFENKKITLTANTDKDQLMQNIKKLIKIISQSNLEASVKLDLIMGLKQGVVAGEGGYVRISLAPIKQYFQSSLAGIGTSFGANIGIFQAEYGDSTSIGFASAAVIGQTIADVFAVRTGSTFSDKKAKHLPLTHPFIQYLEEQIYNLFYLNSSSTETVNQQQQMEQMKQALENSPYKKEIEAIIAKVGMRMQNRKIQQVQGKDNKEKGIRRGILRVWSMPQGNAQVAVGG